MSTYPPNHYQEDNLLYQLEIILKFPLATVISALDSNDVRVTHFPLILEKDADGSYTLVGHADASNPHLELLKEKYPVTAVFSGPNSYISPNDCATRQLPTWNYIHVHVKGEAEWITNEEEERQSLVDMCTTFEKLRNTGYQLDYNDPRITPSMPYIQGFKIKIVSMEGKFKLSKEKSLEDKTRARDILLNSRFDHLKKLINDIILQEDASK